MEIWMKAKAHEPLAKTANLCVLFCSIVFSMFSLAAKTCRSPTRTFCQPLSAVQLTINDICDAHWGHRASSNSLEQRQAGRGGREIALSVDWRGDALNPLSDIIGCLCGGSQCIIGSLACTGTSADTGEDAPYSRCQTFWSAPCPQLTTMNLCHSRFLYFLFFHYEEIEVVIPSGSQCKQTNQVLLKAKTLICRLNRTQRKRTNCC